MFRNGESMPFLEELRNIGKETALDNIPELNETEMELWEIYCFVNSDILKGLDVYANRIGLPVNWEFRTCALLMSKMSRKKFELEKQKTKLND